MEYKTDPGILNILVCPYCHTPMDLNAATLSCGSCQSTYSRSPSGQPDLRLVRAKKYTLDLELGTELNFSNTQFGSLTENPNPEVDLANLDIPIHLSKALISHFPKGNNGIVLDLGSGPGFHKELLKQFGYRYVGLDYDSPAASLRGDAQALPFKDASIDFIISIAVLEHIQHPFVMMKEAYRVLKPGGKFIGTVSFLEPFHDISYYHHTHAGVLNSLSLAGFKTSHISPTPKWSAIRAISIMILFPRLPQWIATLLYLPLQAAHVLWWRAGNVLRRREASSEKNRLLYTAGAFSFIAKKP